MGSPAMRIARTLILSGCLLALGAVAVLAAQASPPVQPRAGAAEAEPPLPAPGDIDGRARALFAAIVSGDPSGAADLFLPRPAFARIKAASNPDAIYDHLFRAYQADIRALHAATPDLAQAQYVRVDFSQRRGFVVPGQEANRIAYWAQRHNTLIYRVGTEERRIELRVLIAWEGRWYLTHLSEFKQPAPAR
jgi:hypothetical protein